MWCYEKSKIEAQWNPKKAEPPAVLAMPEQPPPKPASDEATTTTNSDSCAEPESKPRTKSHRMPRLTRPKLRGLLAALSFEDYHPKPFRKTSKSKRVAAAAATTPEQSTIPSSSSSGSQVESDESSDVFFDAEQFGDLTSDSFGPRESVVLQDIMVSSSQESVETEIKSKSIYRSDGKVGNTEINKCVCCSDGENTTNAASESEEEFEYSEHDFHNRQTDGRSMTHMEDSRTRSHLTVDLIPETVTPPPLVQHPPMAPPAPTELPLRFLRAGKNDPVEGMRRYQATLEMRQQNGLDTILREASPDFDTIKRHYPHYFMGKGKNGEPCFYEQPPKTNLRALREAGVTLDKLLRHYTMVTEFQWNYLERDDLQQSIYVIDLDGIRMTDFVGEAVDFVKKAAAFSAQHYPERAGYVYVINVPAWFKLIWNVISPIIDADTLKKIYILRGKDEIRTNLQARIPLENIPVNFGGTAVPLGESPEEKELADLVAHNNMLAEQGQTVCGHDCKFCKWIPARRY